MLVLAAVMISALPTALVDATRSHRRFDVPAYFAFGDSLADVGTNNFLPQATARADFEPYGKTFFKKPTGRFTNGRNAIDFAGKLKIGKKYFSTVPLNLDHALENRMYRIPESMVNSDCAKCFSMIVYRE